MTFYFARTLDMPFDAAVARVVEALGGEGFGVLSDIDVSATLQRKLGVTFRRYRILGACNPAFAHRALQIEDKVGTMLPCNVVVQESADGRIEIAAVDPVASMQAIDNPQLRDVAVSVQAKLQAAIAAV